MAGSAEYVSLTEQQPASRTLKADDGDSTRLLMLPSESSYSRAPTPDPEEKGYGEVIENPWRFRMAICAMAMMWTSSQIPLYFYGGIQVNVLETIGGYSKFIWLGLANLIPLAIVTPFVGSLSDLFGRRNIGLAAFLFIIIGNVLCSTAAQMNAFLAGTILISIGAGIGELIALAATAEIAPTKDRGLYIGGVVFTILPFTPSTLYAQLIAHASTWRWIGLLIGGWSFVGFVLTFIFYRPPQTKPLYSRRELIRRIDWVGGFLSAVGICLVAIGFSLPTSGYSWKDPRTLTALIVGAVFCTGFAIWEWRFAKWPMFDKRLKEKNPRDLAIVLLITFVSGANFFAVMIYWPTEYQNVYASTSPISIGVGSLPVSLGIIVGSVIVSLLISILKGKIRLLLIVSTVVMVAGNGALAAATKDNLPAMWAVLCIACLGVGASITPVQLIAGIIVPDDLLGAITAATISVRILGGCLAYAIYSLIFASKYAEQATQTIIPELVKIGINSTTQIGEIVDVIRGGGFQLLSQYPGISISDAALLTDIGKDALLKSYPVVYYASIGFGAIAIVASFFLTDIEDQMTADTAVKLR